MMVASGFGIYTAAGCCEQSLGFAITWLISSSAGQSCTYRMRV
jgi:hypothetical protein